MSTQLTRIAKQVKDLEEKKAKLQARQKELLNLQRAREKKEERKRDTRKKIVLGGAVMALQQKGHIDPTLAAYIKETLPKRDRHLFPKLFPSE